MAMFQTYEDCKKYFNDCKAYWMRSGDRGSVAFSKAFWWDCVEIWNMGEWNDAQKKFAMDYRGYSVGNPVPEAEYVERGAV